MIINPDKIRKRLTKLMRHPVKGNMGNKDGYVFHLSGNLTVKLFHGSHDYSKKKCLHEQEMYTDALEGGMRVPRPHMILPPLEREYQVEDGTEIFPYWAMVMERIPKEILPGKLRKQEGGPALEQYMAQLELASSLDLAISDTGFGINTIYSRKRKRLYLCDSTEWTRGDERELEDFRAFLRNGAEGHYLSAHQIA